MFFDFLSILVPNQLNVFVFHNKRNPIQKNEQKQKQIYTHSDPFSPEAVKHREEMILKAAQNSPSGAQANINEGRSYHQCV